MSTVDPVKAGRECLYKCFAPSTEKEPNPTLEAKKKFLEKTKDIFQWKSRQHLWEDGDTNPFYTCNGQTLSKNDRIIKILATIASPEDAPNIRAYLNAKKTRYCKEDAEKGEQKFKIKMGDLYKKLMTGMFLSADDKAEKKELSTSPELPPSPSLLSHSSSSSTTTTNLSSKQDSEDPVVAGRACLYAYYNPKEKKEFEKRKESLKSSFDLLFPKNPNPKIYTDWITRTPSEQKSSSINGNLALAASAGDNRVKDCRNILAYLNAKRTRYLEKYPGNTLEGETLFETKMKVLYNKLINGTFRSLSEKDNKKSLPKLKQQPPQPVYAATYQITESSKSTQPPAKEAPKQVSTPHPQPVVVHNHNPPHSIFHRIYEIFSHILHWIASLWRRSRH